jgi:hypothetical protein
VRKIIAAALCIVLAGCQAARKQQLEDQLNSYLGHPVSEVALRLGPPDTEFDSGSGKRSFQWEKTGKTPGAIVPIGGSLIVAGPQRRECRISVVAAASKSNPGLGDWIVERWTYAGNGCL